MKENANDQLSKILRRAALAMVAIGIAGPIRSRQPKIKQSGKHA